MFTTAWLGGATDKSVTLTGFTVSTGAVYTGGAYNTAGITAKYRRHGANAEVTITLATQTANGAHSDGGFVHVSGGRYRLDLPDAAIASGSDFVDIWVYGITDVYFDGAHVDILGLDPRAAIGTVNVTQIAGQTASASGTVTFPGTIASTTNITAGTITTVTTLTGHTPQTGDAYARLGAPAGASVSADIAAVKSDSAAILVDTGTTLDARIPAALVGGRMNSNVAAVNNTVINGDGAGTPFGP